jgi:L-amino acid N-acyltransferase YncA
MTFTRTIRPVTAADAERICTIYNHYIATTTISFEEEVVKAADMARRIADIETAKLPWLVMVEGDELIGYAYATKWRARAAYRFAVETSVYLDPQHAGKGAGTVLYEALLAELRQRELHLAVGGIAQPNEASVRLHERLGFKKVAHFSEVGLKFGRWIDVGYWQLKLTDGQDKA